MNKAELVEHIAQTANLNSSQAKAALEAVESGVTKALAEGETVLIPASKAPTFKAGSKLKEAVN